MITRKEALCILYGMSFTEENVIALESRVRNYGDLDICHSGDELKPMLQPKCKIDDSGAYHRYTDAKPNPRTTTEGREVMSKLY